MVRMMGVDIMAGEVLFGQEGLFGLFLLFVCLGRCVKKKAHLDVCSGIGTLCCRNQKTCQTASTAPVIYPIPPQILSLLPIFPKSYATIFGLLTPISPTELYFYTFSPLTFLFKLSWLIILSLLWSFVPPECLTLVLQQCVKLLPASAHPSPPSPPPPPPPLALLRSCVV